MDLRALRRFTASASRPEAGSVCEICAAPLEEGHRHVVDLDRRTLGCACRACAILFTSGTGRHRTIPTRIVSAADEPIDEAWWDTLAIPVRLAFLFFHGTRARWVALYPGPAGATEAELPFEAMKELASASRLVRAVEPDVEALLLRGQRLGGAPEAFVVPIDHCYELVGRLRRTWRGFDGGEDARRELDDFFGDLRRRSVPLPPDGRGR
ncbi:DUF5947 family protein [Vulgatibacter incomptus]|uniref:Uncharacterized protein n=1 Tax=Vulgatibacter incomptus TaxID=1391653 RepID=A0A0K1P9F0_9BACT|nr:DUF5947 family protein [Vulgatibacter incomptus]AKU90150.1 hypothetical protein AKJ08_0537 [Vulgatibacter incomptus]